MSALVIILPALAVVCFLIAFCIGVGRLNSEYDKDFDDEQL